MERFIVESWDGMVGHLTMIAQYNEKVDAIDRAKRIGEKGVPVSVTDTEYKRPDGSVGPNIIYEDNC